MVWKATRAKDLLVTRSNALVPRARPLEVPMLESTVTKKGQTTLPKPVRETLGVRAGDRVRYLILDGEVRILPVRPIHRLFGALEHDGPPVSLEQMDEAVAEGAQE